MMSHGNTVYHAFQDLRRLPADTMRQFLLPHAEAIRSSNLALDAILSAAALWDVQERLPSAVVDQICDVQLLTSTLGVEQVHVVAARHQLPLPALGPVDLVVWMLIHHPTLFQEALARTGIEPMRPFRELVGPRDMLPIIVAPAIERLAHSLERYFALRFGRSYCQVHHWRDHELHHFLIRFSDGLRREHVYRDGIVMTEESWPVGCDLVVYDISSGNLRIGARDAGTQAEYPPQFGLLLFQDRAAFRSVPVVSFEPLLDPARALAPTRRIRRVEVLRLELTAPGSKAGSILIDSEDALATLHQLVPARKRVAHIRRARFGLHRTNGQVQQVEITAPDGVTSMRWTDDQVAREFLVERGFLTVPAVLA